LTLELLFSRLLEGGLGAGLGAALSLACLLDRPPASQNVLSYSLICIHISALLNVNTHTLCTHTHTHTHTHKRTRERESAREKRERESESEDLAAEGPNHSSRHREVSGVARTLAFDKTCVASRLDENGVYYMIRLDEMRASDEMK
jgi:hypothetical protein